MRRTALEFLNREGARRFQLDGVAAVGIWKATDTPEMRAAIAILYPSGIQVVRLEDERVPDKYRARKPIHLKAIEDSLVEARRLRWAEWKASIVSRSPEVSQS